VRGVTNGAPDFRADPRSDRLVRLARLLDSSIRIPGTSRRVGLDPVIGLVPGLGDVVSCLISLYIVHQASRMGATRSQIRTMLLNIAIDLVIGEIPLLGDLFDFAFKANERNLRILGLVPDEDAREKSG
jgi:hypothetical protein